MQTAVMLTTLQQGWMTVINDDGGNWGSFGMEKGTYTEKALTLIKALHEMPDTRTWTPCELLERRRKSQAYQRMPNS